MKQKQKLKNDFKKQALILPPRAVPIMIVPDKTYIDSTGNVIPSDVILVSDPIMYEKMKAVLKVWGKEQMGVPGKRGGVDG